MFARFLQCLPCQRYPDTVLSPKQMPLTRTAHKARARKEQTIPTYLVSYPQNVRNPVDTCSSSSCSSQSLPSSLVSSSLRLNSHRCLGASLCSSDARAPVCASRAVLTADALWARARGQTNAGIGAYVCTEAHRYPCSRSVRAGTTEREDEGRGRGEALTTVSLPSGTFRNLAKVCVWWLLVIA